MTMIMKNFFRAGASAAIFCLIAAGAVATENEARGRELVNSLGCKGCHLIDGSGGKLGPALDNVGQRLSGDELYKHITEPKSFNPNSMMPSYNHLREEELKALVNYLEKQK